MKRLKDSPTIETLFHKYKADVNNFLLYYLQTTDVDDVFQETFIHAHRALNKKVNITNERSWLIAIARHAAIDQMRKEKSQKQKIMRITRESIQQEQMSMDDTLQLDERKRMILNAINQMKESYRDVVILRGLKEFDIKETADILHWNENIVRVTYHRALKKLGDILQGGDVYETR